MSTRSSLESFFNGTDMAAVITVPPTLPTNSLCLVNSSISTLLAINYKGEDKLCLDYYPSLPSNNKDLGHGSSYVKSLPSRRSKNFLREFTTTTYHSFVLNETAHNYFPNYLYFNLCTRVIIIIQYKVVCIIYYQKQHCITFFPPPHL